MKELEKAAASMCGVHPDWSKLECFRIGFKEGTQWQAKQSPWISVEERLPNTDNGQSLYEVLVKMNEMADVTWLLISTWRVL